ncbi:MAG: hypothetical protein ACM3ZA_08170 [Bacillota bacterium]
MNLPHVSAAPVEVVATTAGPAIRRVGLWSAVLTTVWAIGFTAAFVWQAVASPPSMTWQDLEAYAASFNPASLAAVLVPSLLLAPSYVALVAAVHGGAPDGRRVWSGMGLAFAVIYAGVASLNYTVQLVVLRGNLLGGEPQGLALVAMGNPRSLFWGLAILGYDFYLALSALFLVPALGRGKLEGWIGRLFAVNAAASIVAGVNYFVTLDAYHPLGLVASVVWCLAFPTATTLMAVRFRRLA